MEPGWINVAITVLSMVMVSGLTLGALKIQAKELTRRLEGMEDKMEKMTQVLIDQATQAVRLDAMDQRLNLQGQRLDAALKSFADGQHNTARMVENVISRVNNLVDKRSRAITDGSEA